MIDLYEGDAVSAYVRVGAIWALMCRVLLFQVEDLRIDAHFLRTHAALAAAAAGQRKLVRVAAADAARLAREAPPWAHTLSTGVAAAVAELKNDVRAATSGFAA